MLCFLGYQYKQQLNSKPLNNFKDCSKKQTRSRLPRSVTSSQDQIICFLDTSQVTKAITTWISHIRLEYLSSFSSLLMLVEVHFVSFDFSGRKQELPYSLAIQKCIFDDLVLSRNLWTIPMVMQLRRIRSLQQSEIVNNG